MCRELAFWHLILVVETFAFGSRLLSIEHSYDTCGIKKNLPIQWELVFHIVWFLSWLKNKIIVMKNEFDGEWPTFSVI